MQRSKIIRNYLKGRFFLDLLSIISLIPLTETDAIENNFFLIIINFIRLY